MKKNRPRASVKQMSGLFGKTRQAWYKAIKRSEQQQMQALLVVQKVKQIRKDLPHCGVRKLYYLLGDFLRRHQIKLGRDKLFALLSEHNLLIKRKKTRRTTFSYHHFRKYPNIIKKLEVVRPNQLWVSDITYISLGASFAYLSLITDAYSRKIIGWSLQENLSATGPLNALSQALKQRNEGKSQPLIHHSDRGLQYCCNAYIEKLQGNKVKISMTENGDPYENALAERVHRTLKEEFLSYYFYFNYEEAQAAIDKAIRLYNHRRPHLSLAYQTPAAVHQEGEAFAYSI